jgi:hypothetical protein
MKILTEKQQLEDQLALIHQEIIAMNGELTRLGERMRKKENWGLLAFDSTPYSSLSFKYERLEAQRKLLGDYYNMIREQIQKIK